MTNQLSFNKTLETHFAQLATIVPSFEQGKIPTKSEDSIEFVHMINVRYGRNSSELGEIK